MGQGMMSDMLGCVARDPALTRLQVIPTRVKADSF
jgi:hypothetical protein